MLEKLENIRKKPKHVRDRYAVGTALVVTALCAIVWGVSLPSQFNAAPKVAKDNDAVGGFSRALSDIKGQFANVTDGVRGALEDTTAATLEAATSTTESNEIDLFKDIYLATSTKEGEPAAGPGTAPRPVLIATSSASANVNNVVQ